MATTKKVARKKTKKKISKAQSPPALLVATAKGAFILSAGPGRKSWTLSKPIHLGSRIHDFRQDPRNPRHLLMTATGGHLGPTIFRSANKGRTWLEASKPPAFKKVAAGKRKKKTAKLLANLDRSVSLNFWLEPGHADEPGSWYVGSSPQGLFRSDDGGDTFKGVKGFNDNENWPLWTENGKAGTPDGPFLHSIQINPRDASHIYLSMSIGGTFESCDKGKTWWPLNHGVAADFIPGGPGEFGHDPHCVVQHPADPDVLYQQNHCGIYRLDRRNGDEWQRIGMKMPKAIGDIGFPIVLHPQKSDVAWVFPMDGTQAWPRTSPKGKPAAYRTENAGKTWQRLSRGFPESNAYLTVKRQAMGIDQELRSLGIYIGTTSGEIWMGRNGGESWSCIAKHLPQIFGISTAYLA